MGRKKRKDIIKLQKELTDEYQIVWGKYGPYKRKRVKAHDPKTKSQVKVRNSFGELAAIWRSISSKEMRYWDMYARDIDRRKYYTNAKTMTGQIFFNTVNRNQQEAEAPMIKKCPFPMDAQMFEKMDIIVINNKKVKDIVLKFEPEMEAYTKLSIFATPPVRENKLYVNPNEFKKIHVIGSVFKAGDSIKSAYLNKYKNMPGVGEKAEFLVKSYNISCGTVSQPKKIISPVNE